MASSTCYREQDRAFNKGEEAVRFLKHLMRRRRIPRGNLLVSYVTNKYPSKSPKDSQSSIVIRILTGLNG
jgi:hypothetical protein